MPRDDQSCQTALAYCWIGGAQDSPQMQRLASEIPVGLTGSIFPHDTPPGVWSVQCDDDFVVMFTIYGFVVWCFDESVSLLGRNPGGSRA